MNKPANGQTWPQAQEAIQEFPPTHGAGINNEATTTDPTLISIVDLEKLATMKSNTGIFVATVATFKLPGGCSFLSFSPNGLALFTASSKGDVQFVWDLMRIQFTKSSPFQPHTPGPSQGQHVRQIAFFDRLTVAKIIDVAWTLPDGMTLAMVTENNTVHFLDLPSNAFSWPPPRMRGRAQVTGGASAEQQPSPPVSVASRATNAMTAAWGFTQPLLQRPRRFSGPSPNPGSSRTGALAAGITAFAGHGGKAIASGISKSFGAATGTIQSFRRAGDNKIHLPLNPPTSSRGHIRWLGGQGKETFAALVDGIVKVYTVKHVQSKKNPGKWRIRTSSTPHDLKLPYIPEYDIAPACTQSLGPDEEDAEPETVGDYGGTNKGLRLGRLVQCGLCSGQEPSIPQAEIESNAPYQPFHTDPRISIFAYSSTEAVGHSADELWVFGQPMQASKIHSGVANTQDDDLDGSEHHRALPQDEMERVTSIISDSVMEPIVSTTFRRKGSHKPTGGPTGDDVSFEDDHIALDFAALRV
jgi:hypothetical protein